MVESSVSARAASHLDFISHSPQQTQRVGFRLGQLARAGDIVLLSGDFGAGKTLLAQGIARGLGADRPVTSPSFTLVHEYRLVGGAKPARFYHIDLYRLESVTEIETLGLEAYSDDPDAMVAIEWPERLPVGYVQDYLLIHIGVVSETKRRLRFTPRGPRYHELVLAVKAEAFGVDG